MDPSRRDYLFPPKAKGAKRTSYESGPTPTYLSDFDRPDERNPCPTLSIYEYYASVEGATGKTHNQLIDWGGCE